MKQHTLSPRTMSDLMKYNLALWQLYTSSYETIWHRLNMMATQPSNHPEFSRMIQEKEQAFSSGMFDGIREMQQQAMAFWLRPYSSHSLNKAIGASLKLSNAMTKKTHQTANANAKRLRRT